MAAFFSAMQRVKFGSAAGRRAASARSEKIEFTGWALHGHSLGLVDVVQRTFEGSPNGGSSG
jgi:hypothetical protein